ncbi:hypothetical protein ACIBJF_34840 [Streptomyces sp. NPDC050743]
MGTIERVLLALACAQGVAPYSVWITSAQDRATEHTWNANVSGLDVTDSR